MRVAILRADGTTVDREITRINGQASIIDLQGLVGGWVQEIQVWYRGKARRAYVNEEAGMDHLKSKFEFNRQATDLTMARYDSEIRGNMVIELGDLE